jgi:hypothetical protein
MKGTLRAAFVILRLQAGKYITLGIDGKEQLVVFDHHIAQSWQ